MTPAPSISVVIPCFRNRDTLTRALRSVAQQTTQPMEVILVDDGNTAEERAFLEEIPQHLADLRVRLIRLDHNHGAAAARNAGWDAACGDLIAFLDADDAWHPRKLEIQQRFLRDHPDVALCGHRAAQITDENTLPQQATLDGWSEITPKGLLFSNRFITPSAMLRHDLTLRFRTMRRHMEDHLLWLEIAFAGYRIAYLDSILAYTFKPAFGWSGLSSNLWAMEKAELGNYRILRQQGHIGRATEWFFYTYSLLKYLRRIGITVGHRLRSSLPRPRRSISAVPAKMNPAAQSRPCGRTQEKRRRAPADGADSDS